MAKLTLLDMRAQGGGGSAPIDATFITQTPSGTLTNEQALSLLATGLLKSTTVTGVVSIAAQGTDYYAPGDLAAVAVSGDYGDLLNLPTLGTMAAFNDAPSDGSTYGRNNGAWAVVAAGVSPPFVDETAIVYKTGNVAITQTYNIDAYTVARVVAWPDAAGTVPLLEVANVFTAAQKINANSTTALFVERDGVNDNVLVVDTTNARIGINTAPVAGDALRVQGDGGVAIQNSLGGRSFYLQAIMGSASGSPAQGLFYPGSAGNTYMTFYLIPKGTGASGLRTILSLFHDDFITSSANFGRLNLWVADAEYRIEVVKTGSGLLYPLKFNMGTDEVIVITTTSRVGIGTAAPGAKLHADQSSTTGAIPVLTLDQADIDEDFISFIGDSSASTADRSLVKPSDFPTPGAIVAWLKCKITDNRVGGIGTIDAWIPAYATPTV